MLLALRYTLKCQLYKIVVNDTPEFVFSNKDLLTYDSSCKDVSIKHAFNKNTLCHLNYMLQ